MERKSIIGTRNPVKPVAGDKDVSGVDGSTSFAIADGETNLGVDAETNLGVDAETNLGVDAETNLSIEDKG